MRNLIKLSDFNKEEIFQIFEIADEIKQGKYLNILSGKTVLMFLPQSSVRTRVTFEKGIHLLGGQSILFDSEVLSKKEAIEDVIGYLNNWVDLIIVRHNDTKLIKEIARYSKLPVINAMSIDNHPCEILSDLYALSKIRKDYLKDHYLYVGPTGNIGLTWGEASALLGFPITQCCPIGYEMNDVKTEHDIKSSIKNKDIILTDSLSQKQLQDFQKFQITCELMSMANEQAILNPCPPFHRGEEVTADVVNSTYFVGYEFKKALLEVQQAIMIFCMIF